MPAPAPVEQRWMASSRSSMSPASCSSEEDFFLLGNYKPLCWITEISRSMVGIIMYLPTMDARQRKDITEEFFHYRHLTEAKLWDRYSAYEHWANIDIINQAV